MAGGEGAKERRRLKRLAAQEAQKKSEIKPKQNEAKETNANNFRDNRNNRKQSNFSAAKGRNNNNSKNNGKKEKKPKFKKPKHLKRKLEQAANDNGEAKEDIEKKIEQFEAKKVFYSKRNNINKRQKSAKFDSGNNDRAEFTQNKLNHISSPFPRSEKVEIKEPDVVEDDNIEMEDHKETIELEDPIEKDVPSITNTESGEDSSQESSDDKSLDKDTGGKVASESIERDSVDTSDQSSVSDNDSDPGSSNKSDNDDSDDSDDSSDDDEPVQKRQRGRRRRGRQDTAEKVAEMEAAEKTATSSDKNDKSKDKDEDNSANKGKKRYCIGRKPVTDFVLGQRYPAKVVYVKPFGVFFDIGCHSDAFCHVSRLSDDFIESPESKFKEGDEVSEVRVVEIDRKQKRITLSLQSEARIEDERVSIEARKSRKDKRNKKSKKQPVNHSSGNDRSENFTHTTATSFSKNDPPATRSDPTPPKKNLDPSKMSPAELKRARKLARRAERRAQAEQQEQ